MKYAKDSQSREVQKVFDQLLYGNIVFSLLCWFGLLTFLYEAKFRFWTTGTALTILGIVMFIYFSITKKSITIASQVYLIWFLLSLPNGLLLLDASYRLIVYSIRLEGSYLYLLLGFNFVLIIGSILIQISFIRDMVKSSENQNIKSGRLNIKEGLWDLTKPLYIDSGESENKTRSNFSRISKLSPIVIAMTFFVARTVEGKTQTLIVGIAYLFVGCLIFWGFSRHLAVALQIREWEKTYGIKINLPT
jgi:hypothetical protein